MKKIAFAKWLAGPLLGALSVPAFAVPVHATFDGTVSGSTSLFTNVLSTFAVGTLASFDVTFDDGNLAPAAPLLAYDLAPVSGWLRLGGLEWALDAGTIGSYTYQLTPGNPITNYGLQLTGSGPTIAGGASLFGLFLRLTPSLDPFSSTSLQVGFAYPVTNGEIYSYADLSGEFSASRGTTSVPEPGTLSLAAMGLLLIGIKTRSRLMRAAN